MNKKSLALLFICVISLFMVSAVSASENQTDTTLAANSNYQITSDLSNNDIQNLFEMQKMETHLNLQTRNIKTFL